MFNNYIRIIRILFIFILGSVLSAQSMEELKRLREAYEDMKEAQEEEAIIQEGVADEKKIGAEGSMRLLVKPAEIKEYYIQKMNSIRSELKSLENLLSYTDSVMTLQYFGYDYFNQRDSIPLLANIPISSDYILGPDDEVIISMWGQAEQDERKILRRDGTIFIENVGLLYLGGKTLSQAKTYIHNRFSKVYSTLLVKPPTTYFDLSLGKIKNINIIISGHVARPGNYVIHPAINLFNVLVTAGGIDTTGTLRLIKILRNNTVIDSIDLYPLITGAGKIKSINFHDSDIVLVPPRYGTVAVTGAVLKPAYYEPLKDEVAGNLIKYAGGLNRKAGTHLTIVSRISNNKIKSVKNLDNIGIQHGDSLHVPINTMINLNVSISGAIGSPGVYPWFDGMTVKDLLLVSGAEDIQIKKYADYSNAEIVRQQVDGLGFKEVQLNFMEIIKNKDNSENFTLAPYDHITIPRKKGYFLAEKVFIFGEVSAPGEYPLLNEKESLESILNRTGGVLPGAFENGIIIKRDSLVVGWINKEVLLAPGDSIYVPRQPGTVKVLGMVHNPGYYKWEKGKSVAHYVRLAGGLKVYADKQAVVLRYPNGLSAPASGLFGPEVTDGCIITAHDGKERPSSVNMALDILSRTLEPLVSLASVLVLVRTANQ